MIEHIHLSLNSIDTEAVALCDGQFLAYMMILVAYMMILVS